MNIQTKSPAIGVDSGASGLSNLGGGDKADYTEKSDYWNELDNFKLSTNITDFLMLHIDAHGIGRSQNLVNAVSFIKRESEKLAFNRKGGV